MQPKYAIFSLFCCSSILAKTRSKYSSVPTSIDTICGLETDKVRISAGNHRFESDLKLECRGHWIESMVPYLTGFIDEHKSCKLVVFNSCGGLPRYPDGKTWYRWKEVAGPMTCWSEGLEEVDLPINMIDDLCIDNWSDALARY